MRNAGVQIYCDENTTPSLLPTQSGQYTTAPNQVVTNKENEQKAGVWTKRKVGLLVDNVKISFVPVIMIYVCVFFLHH